MTRIAITAEGFEAIAVTLSSTRSPLRPTRACGGSQGPSRPSDDLPVAEDAKPGVRQGVLDDLVQDRREFGRREGAQSLSANVAEFPEAHQQCGRRGVIRRVQDDDGIVLPLRPVESLTVQPAFFAAVLKASARLVVSLSF